MIDETVSTTIQRPIDEVFEFVADMTNEPRWHTDIVEAQRIDEGVPGSGSRFRVKFRPRQMGPSEGVVEVKRSEPERIVVQESEMGNMSPTITNRFEEASSGTRVIRRIQIETSGVTSVMAPLMGMMVRRANRRFVDNLKTVLED